MEIPQQNAEPPPRAYVLGDDASASQRVLGVLRDGGVSGREFRSVDTLLDEPCRGGPGCVVVCCPFSGAVGLEVHDRLAAAGQSLPVIVVTDQADVPTVVRLMERGVVSVLEKSCHAEELVNAVSRALRLAEIRGSVRRRFDTISAAVERLSPREKSVLQAIAAGQLNKAIARSLDVSIRTVESDRAKIVDKFEADSTGEVVGKYAQYRLLTEMEYPTLGLKAARETASI